MAEKVRNKKRREDSSVEVIPQATRKPRYIIAVLSLLVLLAMLALVATQHNSFDRWQSQLSAWWSDFSTATPPQANSSVIPHIPEVPQTQLPVSSAMESATPDVVPAVKALDVGAPESFQLNSEDPLTPETGLLSNPAEVLDSESQLEKTWEEAGVMSGDIAGESVVQANDLMLTDGGTNPRQELIGGEQSLPADVVLKAVPPPAETSALEALEAEEFPATERILQVEFDFDSAELSSVSVGVVEQAIQYMTNTEGCTALIVGYSDNHGADQYNLSLSRRRAETVARYLADRGVSQARLRVEGRGAIQVSASTATDGLLSSYREWRIVEIRISAPGQP